MQNINLKELIRDLQAHGISVNASAILFLEQHTPESMQKDIDWTIDLEADMTQFMNYTPYPGTILYDRLNKEGCLKNTHYRFQHGQGELNWEHPHMNNIHTKVHKAVLTTHIHGTQKKRTDSVCIH